MTATTDWAARLEVSPCRVARELDRIFRELVDARSVLTTLERAHAVLPVLPSEVWDSIDKLADAVYDALRAVQNEARA